MNNYLKKLRFWWLEMKNWKVNKMEIASYGTKEIEGKYDVYNRKNETSFVIECSDSTELMDTTIGLINERQFLPNKSPHQYEKLPKCIDGEPVYRRIKRSKGAA